MNFDNVRAFIANKKVEKKLKLGKNSYRIGTIKDNILNNEIDDNNDWIITLKLFDKDQKSHVLELIWNEDRSLVFVGAFLDNVQVYDEIL